MKMLVHEHYKPGDLHPFNKSRMDLGSAWLFNIVVFSHSWLGSSICNSSAVKRQKEQCQSMLSCEIKTLGGTPSFPPCSLSVPAHLGCQGRLAVGRVGIGAWCWCCPELWEGSAASAAQQPLCSSQCVSLLLGSHPGGSKQTGLRDAWNVTIST